MLRVTVLGHLGADPETRQTQKGHAMATFRVAVNQADTTADGERQERAEWFRVRAMGRLGEYVQRLQKGERVLVVGRLEISHYQSREGEPRVGFDVWADEVVSLSPRTTGGDGPEESDRTPASQAPTRRSRPVAEPESGQEDDDLPF